MQAKSMTLAGVLIGLLVTMIWGFNYTAVRIGEDTFSSWALADLRFILSFFPLCFFVKKPNTSWKVIIAYGLTFGFLQFTLFFLAMEMGTSSGITAIIGEVQVYFTIFLATIIDKEKLTFLQIVGMILSFSGIALLFFVSDGSTPLVGVLLVVASSFFLAVSNIIVKNAQPDNNFSFLIWASGVSIIPLTIGIMLWDDKTKYLIHHLDHLQGKSVIAIFYTAYISGIVGFGLWNKMLGTYKTATVVPMSLLVPIFGLIFGHLFLAESIGSLKIFSCILMIIGLLIAQFGDRVKLLST